jgi:hypothetical protein
MKISELNGSILKADLDMDAVRFIRRNRRKDGSLSFTIEILKGRKTFELKGCVDGAENITMLGFYYKNRLAESINMHGYIAMIASLRDLIARSK